MAPRKEKLEFTGAMGVSLSAILDTPEEAPRAYAIFAHCFTCSKDFLAPARVGRELAERGIAVLRFDFTGLGNSCGEFEETGFSTNVGDIEAAASFLRDQYEPPSLLIGHSLGGAASLAASSRIPELGAIVTIAAPSRPAGLRRLTDPVADTIRAKGAAEVFVAGRPFKIGKMFLDDMETFTLELISEQLQSAKKALMILHSPADETVDVRAASELFAAAPHPKSFVSLDDADHLLSKREDAHWVASLIESWSSRYVG